MCNPGLSPIIMTLTWSVCMIDSPLLVTSLSLLATSGGRRLKRPRSHDPHVGLMHDQLERLRDRALGRAERLWAP
eukprot:9261169-Pyramimonas_sp.AAC.1